MGAAVEITVPIGEYNDNRLINLGGNRWVVKPQIGVVHNWNKWSAELTASAWFYADNDDFFRDTELERDPIYGVQSHLIYNFRPGLWASLSGAYGAGGESKVDGQQSGDRVGKTLWALSGGGRSIVARAWRLPNFSGDSRQDTGSDENSYLLAYSLMWCGM